MSHLLICTLLSLTLACPGAATDTNHRRAAIGPAAAASDTGSGRILPTAPADSGIWINAREIAALPTSGKAWDNLKRRADSDCGPPQLNNQDSKANTCVLAKALVFARVGGTRYRDDVVTALRGIVESGPYQGRALALGRELSGFVIAADVIRLASYDPALDASFRAKLRELRAAHTINGVPNLIACHEIRPNNWGAECGASRIAVDIYLADTADLARAVRVFRGYLGDRTAWSGFKFKDASTTWSPTPDAMVPINPRGARVLWNGQSYNVDGAVIDDFRRGCSFQWAPCHTGYPWEGLAGVIIQGEMLHRRGYAVYEWQDQAIRRAYEYLHWLASNVDGYWFQDGTYSGDDNWQPWIVNKRYGIKLPSVSPTTAGKAMGWTDWTHGN